MQELPPEEHIERVSPFPGFFEPVAGKVEFEDHNVIDRLVCERNFRH
jgi:hypothetical protein